jgi:nucleotide-binding universal stress UspA family protein
MAARPRRIMVGYDGSDGARRALEAAADLVGYGSTLTVVTVQTAEVGPSVASDARDRLRHRHVEARYQEPTGEPVDRLLAAAGELDADLVVVTRSNSSARIVRSAACDVLVVR